MKFAKIAVFVACTIGAVTHGEIGLRSTSSCGGNNQPACSGSCYGNTALWTLDVTEWCCDNNKNFEGGSCVACGNDGQKPCANVDQSRFGCESGKTIIPFGSAKPMTTADVASTNAVCKSCGGNNQPSCVSQASVSTNGACAGSIWQDGSGFTCCDNNKNFEGGSCVACGNDGQKPCANVDQSRFGCESGKTITPFGSPKPVTTADVASTNAVCKSCGGNNQPACTTTSNPAGSCGGSIWQDGSGFTCCDNSKNFEGGSCVACGNDGQKPCANVDQSRFGCESGKTIIPFGSAKPVTTADVASTNAVCKSCGGNNQPSCVSQASVSTNGACAGSIWQDGSGFTCCDNNKNLVGSSCVACGNDGQAPCMNVDKTRFGCESGKTIIPPVVALLSPESGSCSADSWLTVLSTVAKCKSCGGNNQPACLTSSSNGPTSSCGSKSFWQLDYSGVCCDNTKNYENRQCVACGNAGQKPCANVDAIRFGCESGKTIIPAGSPQPQTVTDVASTSARCQSCGGKNQPECQTRSIDNF